MISTKAWTLDSLKKSNIDGINVLPLIFFTVEKWNDNRKKILEDIESTGWFRDYEKLIVRSSACNEDSNDQSLAGHYLSVPDVINVEELETAVDKVIASYGAPLAEDEILIQPMLSNVAFSGVAFTIDPNSMGNYYVINYSIGGDTAEITSGKGMASNQKTLYVFKGTDIDSNVKNDDQNHKADIIIKLCDADNDDFTVYKNNIDISVNPDLFKKALCRILHNLERHFNRHNLDVEFAVTSEGKIYVFQVRTLVVNDKKFVGCDVQSKILNSIAVKIENENCHKPFLLGKRTIWGVMPDWNPAEMIGVKPKPLALSLYKEIITDSIWAYQRDNYGYRNLRSVPLLQDFYGLPYIDTRVSFNSFIPADLNEEIGEKLVDYYLDKLENNPQYHDKIEFEVAYTCYTLDIRDRISCLREYGFSLEEISVITESLRSLTRKIIDNKDGLWKSDYKKIEVLQSRYDEICGSDLDVISKLYWLLEDCKRYGTLPFAGLARAGFIAVQLMKSLVSTGILTTEEYNGFMQSLNTVSTMMTRDKLTLSRKEFIKKYGHLRPGTYDILSKRYDEAPDLFFKWEDVSDYKEKEDFKLSLKKYESIESILKSEGISNNVLDFFAFIKGAIEGREYAKFIFTRSLSKALTLIEQLGKENGISREELAYTNITSLLQLYGSCYDSKSHMEESISSGKKRYKTAESIDLPSLICSKDDIFSFHDMDTIPNFITQKRVVAKVLDIDVSDIESSTLENKIILMRSADPGYDWIFTRNISGFITQYGGVNSHMAIRAGELGIPAAIGVGQSLFNAVSQATVVDLDAIGKRITII